ncbi:hypothetical protein BCV70DRAFT_199566 [Testicularia cyperi]|uniref:Uncharacterized protein n=1 Tax=Testicularia cyperi TaxID=1882483 RepID=A0A317XSA6_9BASI|nr:hypothetical protein BCV70DRAFT_199566 [Testicularia cyperi]
MARLSLLLVSTVLVGTVMHQNAQAMPVPFLSNLGKLGRSGTNTLNEAEEKAVQLGEPLVRQTQKYVKLAEVRASDIKEDVGTSGKKKVMEEEEELYDDARDPYWEQNHYDAFMEQLDKAAKRKLYPYVRVSPNSSSKRPPKAN